MEDQANVLHSELLGKLFATSCALLDIAHKLQSPESLPVLTTKDNSADVARKTLRWLRNLQDITLDMEDWMYVGNLPEQQIKAQYLQNLISIYAGQVKIAQLSNPDLLNHFTIDHANHAVGSIALSISLHTVENLSDDNHSITQLNNQLDNVLPQWDSRQTQSVEQLIDAIESGLTHLVNKPLGDRSPVDRLIEVSNNLQEAVRQLYSIDTLEDPAREESIELAREILRRLKNLSFSDKPIEEAIDTGKPNEKLAFAQRISGMVDMYKNLLFEAMRINPDIVNDIRVKNANDAAGWCSNGVALMAAKEIPNNSAATQQISVDIKQIVNSGKSLSGFAINKLMHKMEGGVERAAEQISSHEKQEHNKVSAEAEIAAKADKARRTRRRQVQGTGSGASQRANTAIQHETVKSNLRGDAGGVGSLNKMDIAAVRQAGNSLRKSNRQANDILLSSTKMDKNTGMITTVSNVPANTKITPDDKGFASRERDVLNPNHPRNRPRIG